MNRFATHPMFDIDGLDWLTATLTAKTTKLTATDTPATTPKDNETWEDRCACIGMINSDPARALCSMLIWGYNQAEFDVIRWHLAGVMYNQMLADNKAMPQGFSLSIEQFCFKVANMVLYLHLYDLWDFYTVAGRLYFCSIPINDRTYSNQFTKYQKQLIKELQDLADIISNNITNYRMALKNI